VHPSTGVVTLQHPLNNTVSIHLYRIALTLRWLYALSLCLYRVDVKLCETNLYFHWVILTFKPASYCSCAVKIKYSNIRMPDLICLSYYIYRQKNGARLWLSNITITDYTYTAYSMDFVRLWNFPRIWRSPAPLAFALPLRLFHYSSLILNLNRRTVLENSKKWSKRICISRLYYFTLTADDIWPWFLAFLSTHFINMSSGVEFSAAVRELSLFNKMWKTDRQTDWLTHTHIMGKA